jgi:uncharacterized Zn finger protein (UPF0148 family)
MRCSKCGTSFGSADVFCPECGIRVSGQSQAPFTEAPAAKQGPATPERTEEPPEEDQDSDGPTEPTP